MNGVVKNLRSVLETSDNRGPSDPRLPMESRFVALFEKHIGKLLTVKELAVVLCASEKTIRDWVLKGLIPVVRPQPRMVRFNPLAIARWLAERSCY